ncbi:hypothetical protein C0991_001364 [Blastosporella zonata]|nr:hypothetical protein C0991_001364 [Blastosporella zonata]
MFMDRATYTDANKIEYFELSLKDGGPAAEWFKNLEEEKRLTWSALVTEFDERWPARQALVKSQEEKQEELKDARIMEAELGKKVTMKGVEVWMHIVWADKVQQLARAIPDNGNLLVSVARDNMAPSLRATVPPSNKTWDTFCKAVREVGTTELREKMAERKEAEQMKAELERMRSNPNRQPPPTPLKVAAAALDRMKLGPTIPAPNFGPVQTSNSTLQPTTTQNGQIMQTAYLAMVMKWHSNNPGAKAGTKVRPYPLTPGTAALGSGECTKCGMMGHFWESCTATPAAIIPPFESKWRCKVNSIRRTVNAPTTSVNVVNVDVNKLTEGELHQHLESFFSSQGKGQGSSD